MSAELLPQPQTQTPSQAPPRPQKAKTAAFITQESRRSLLLRLPWLGLIPLGWLLPVLSAGRPDLVERIYNQGVYPVLNAVLRNIFGIFPFSVVEWILYALILLLPALLLYRAVSALFGRMLWVRVAHLCLTYLILFGVLLNAFYIVWGFNYSRGTVASLLELDVRARPVEELEVLCFSLSEAAAELRAGVQEDANGVFTLTGGVGACLRKVPDAYAALGRELPLFRMHATRPKWVANSEGMSWMGISGIYIPFTAEPNVNVHQPPLLLPASAAHESAHGLGIARENEANFVSYLACLHSDSTDLRYSGVMLALVHGGNQLYAADPERYTLLYDSYSEGMKRDLQQHSAYWKGYEGPVEETMDRVNDGYLRHNQQESGIKSYGEVVDLLLAWQEKSVA